jgi:glycosyltransferase involved in cell wall biosynthesis/predicted Zn-dependent protease
VLLRQGKAAEAEEHWRAALTEQPAFTLARLGLAELYLGQGRWADLEGILVGHAALPVSRVATSEAACATAVLNDPAWEFEAETFRAQACLARKEFGQARQILEGLIGRVPQAVRPRVLLSHALLQEQRDPPAAERALRELLILDPRRGESWRNLALLLHTQGRLAEAVAAGQSGLAHCPADPLLLFQHGSYLVQAGDLAGAEHCLLRFLESFSTAGNPPAWAQPVSARHQLALVYMQQRRGGEAEAQWRAALAERADHLPTLLGLAELYLAQQRWVDLEQVVARLESFPEGTLEAPIVRARRHLAQREFGPARQLLEELLVRTPEATWVRVILSRVLLEEGRDLAAAERVLREVLALAPGHPEATHNLTVLLRGQGRGGSLDETMNAPVTSDGHAENVPHGERHVANLPHERVRIGLVCFNPLPKQLETPRKMPLGGSESALCYLAEALAGAGHEVFVIHPAGHGEVSRGVRSLPLMGQTLPPLPPLDALVVLNLAGQGRALRAAVGPSVRLILWTQHALDQPAVVPLHEPAERAAYDAFAFVSEWQRRQYVHQFGLDAETTVVLRNGIGPAFQSLFAEDEPIRPAKVQPPVLAYTSTPYRGLDLLLDAFPRIRQAVPGVILKVFSSMGVYQLPEAEDSARFGWLYRRCRETEGIAYIGSRPQPELAAELKAASVLAYPNSYPETSCIAVLEAMAAGCVVVTSRRAALPETTAGFGRLVPPDDDRPAYVDAFVGETVQALTDLTGADGAAVEEKLRRQVAHVNRIHSWTGLAGQWVEWLSRLGARVSS